MATTPKKQTFKQAFASNRAAGKKEFTWNGKSYNTKLATDTKKPAAKKFASTPKEGPIPTPAPRGSSLPKGMSKNVPIAEDKKTNTGSMKLPSAEKTSGVAKPARPMQGPPASAKNTRGPFRRAYDDLMKPVGSLTKRKP